MCCAVTHLTGTCRELRLSSGSDNIQSLLAGVQSDQRTQMPCPNHGMSQTSANHPSHRLPPQHADHVSSPHYKSTPEHQLLKKNTSQSWASKPCQVSHHHHTPHAAPTPYPQHPASSHIHSAFAQQTPHIQQGFHHPPATHLHHQPGLNKPHVTHTRPQPNPNKPIPAGHSHLPSQSQPLQDATNHKLPPESVPHYSQPALAAAAAAAAASNHSHVRLDSKTDCSLVYAPSSCSASMPTSSHVRVDSKTAYNSAPAPASCLAPMSRSSQACSATPTALHKPVHPPIGPGGRTGGGQGEDMPRGYRKPQGLQLMLHQWGLPKKVVQVQLLPRLSERDAQNKLLPWRLRLSFACTRLLLGSVKVTVSIN